jgi:AI-2 transport protein TqsA
MTTDSSISSIRVMVALCTVILVTAALFLASPIVEPIAFALFFIALVYPFQRVLQKKIPKSAALCVVLLITLVGVAAFLYMIAWGFGVVKEWAINNAATIQNQYAAVIAWLEAHDLPLPGAMAVRLDAKWIVPLFREVAGRLNSVLGFSLIAFLFLMLGLMEVGEFMGKFRILRDEEAAQQLLQVGQRITDKLRKYMVVRTLASLLVGLLTWGIARVAGLELAIAWGTIAFALNFIPFLGSFVATILPALFAVVQFGPSRMPLIILFALAVMQFVIGNYLEPLFSGTALNISPFTVVFSVFFWSFMWGLPGALIGVPLMLAFLAICEDYPSTRWVSVLLSVRPPQPRSS